MLSTPTHAGTDILRRPEFKTAGAPEVLDSLILHFGAPEVLDITERLVPQIGVLGDAPKLASLRPLGWSRPGLTGANRRSPAAARVTHQVGR